MCTIALVTPANDLRAATLAGWADDLRRRAGSRHGLTSTEQSRLLAQRANFEDYVKRENPEALFFFGHGSWESLDGYEPVVDRSNIGLLAGKPIVAVACRSAHSLGEDAVDSLGVRSYLGFSEDLTWLRDRSAAFGNVVVSGLEPLIQGKTAGESRAALIAGFENLVHRFKYDEARTDKIGPFAYLLAHWNSTHVKLCGDTSSTLHSGEFFGALKPMSEV
jgi:hypothetical protein